LRRPVAGSKNFTEQLVLGEILAQRVEQAVGGVDRRLNLGGTLLAHEAVVRGEIDFYPEYTGTALTAVLKRAALPAREAFEAVGRAYRKLGLGVMAPLGFDNSFAMVVRGKTARELGIATMSEAVKARAWKLGAGYEFTGRPDGLPLLERTYGLKTAGSPVLMDLGLLYAALEQRQVDLVAGNATDGVLSKLDAVVLRDDRGAFPAYEACVVVRSASMERYPKLEAALQEMSGRIDAAAMRRMNQAVDGEKRSPAEVAREFLRGIQ
jgi:glycine betaine/choline ABC-type transport system substrate-binding protein